MDKQGVNLGTHRFKETIERLVESGMPPLPAFSSTEKDRLRFHTTGIYVLREVLGRYPIPKLGYRELSRYLSRVTTARMMDMPVFDELPRMWAEFDEVVAPHSQRVRKFYWDILDSTKSAYRPFVTHANVHLWFWDDETRDKALDMLGNAHLPVNLFYALAADPLSEISSLSESRRSDLRAEYYQGIACLSYVQSALKWALSDCRARADGE